jgi:hypothetical protein
MEERNWKELTEGLNFSEEIDPAFLQPPFGDDFMDHQDFGEYSNAATAKLEELFQKEEGNSIFYANSMEGCSQMPSTSFRFVILIIKFQILNYF